MGVRRNKSKPKGTRHVLWSELHLQTVSDLTTRKNDQGLSLAIAHLVVGRIADLHFYRVSFVRGISSAGCPTQPDAVHVRYEAIAHQEEKWKFRRFLANPPSGTA